MVSFTFPILIIHYSKKLYLTTLSFSEFFPTPRTILTSSASGTVEIYRFSDATIVTHAVMQGVLIQ
jgi:hypothetical protein